MREEIKIEGLNIPVSQTITGIVLRQPHNVERTSEGIVWHGEVMLMSGDQPLGNRQVRNAIRDNSTLTLVELTAKAQELYNKDYLELTVVESQQVQGETMASKMIAAINASDSGIAVADISTLVSSIVSALA